MNCLVGGPVNAGLGAPGGDARETAQFLSNQAGMAMVNTKLPLQNEANMEITGDDQQILTISLDPEEEVLVEPGCMVWADSGIKSGVSTGGWANCCTRLCCLGQGGFRVHWKNEVSDLQRIGLTPTFPAKVVPIKLEDHSKELFIKGGSFMAGTDPDLAFSFERAGRKTGGTFSKGVFGGQGLFLTKVTGQGWVFLSAAGAIYEKRLREGETIIVDQASVVAWETTVGFGYRAAGGVGMMCCGGEGLTNTTLTGPGYVVIQSMPFEKVRIMVARGDGNESGGQGPIRMIAGLAIFFIYICIMVTSNLDLHPH